MQKEESDWGLAGNLWRHRDLLKRLCHHDISAEYQGLLMGKLWAVGNPLVILCVYTFVFGYIFKARWMNSGTDSLLEFAVTLFCGLIVFGVFSAVVNQAPRMVVSKPNYVKRIVFPLELLPVCELVRALFHAGVSMLILTVAAFLMQGTIPVTILLLPLLLVPLVFLTLGFGWLLAGLGVFLRDLGQLVVMCTHVLFFLCPVFYGVEMMPPRLQFMMKLNPLAFIITGVRQVVLWGDVPSPVAYVVWSLALGIFMGIGYTMFMRMKPAFADVI